MAQSWKAPGLNHGLRRNPERSGRIQPEIEQCDVPHSKGMANEISRRLAGYYGFADGESYVVIKH